MTDTTKHILAISGGKDSTALALRMREVEPEKDYEYLITPVGNELPEMAAHWSKLENLLGKPLHRLKPFTDGDGLLWLIEHYSALPMIRQRWCTRQLKIEPTIVYLMENTPCVQYVGLRADEETRGGIYGDFPGVEQRYPFREWGWTDTDVWDYLAEKGIRIPKRTDCAFCYGQRIGEWYRLYRDNSHLYEQAVAIEERTGHTFRSPSRDSWPASLAELAKMFDTRIPRGEARPGSIQLDMWDAGEAEEKPCRVCSL